MQYLVERVIVIYENINYFNTFWLALCAFHFWLLSPLYKNKNKDLIAPYCESKSLPTADF